MAQPTLFEMLNVRVDPMLDTGAQGVVMDIDRGTQQLFQAAQMKSKADWDRYTNFQTNLMKFYENAGKIVEVDMLASDRKAVMEKYSEFLKEASKDPMALFNPLGNMERYGELSKMGANVMSLAQKSKQDRVFDEAHRKFIMQSPEWNTPENRAIIESFVKTPVEERQAYILGGPIPSFDLGAMAEQWNKAATATSTRQYVSGELYIDKDGSQKTRTGSEWMTTEEVTSVDPTRFRSLAEGAWGLQDKYGNQMREWVKRFVYDPLPETEKQRLAADGGDPIKNAYLEYTDLLRGKGSSKLTQEMSKVWETKTKEAAALQRTRVMAAASAAKKSGLDIAAAFDLYKATYDIVKNSPNGELLLTQIPGKAAQYIKNVIKAQSSDVDAFMVDIKGKKLVAIEGGYLNVVDVNTNKVITTITEAEINPQHIKEVMGGVSGTGEQGAVRNTPTVPGGAGGGRTIIGRDENGLPIYSQQ